MAPPDEGDAPDPMDELREVVPARAVLTELARGFLLMQSSDPDRAVEFASSFLRERSGMSPPAGPERTRPVVLPRRRPNEPRSGPSDPSNGPPAR